MHWKFLENACSDNAHNSVCNCAEDDDDIELNWVTNG